jgi:excisionase family DNA binding protein
MSTIALEDSDQKTRDSLPVRSPSEIQRKKIIKVLRLLERSVPTGRSRTPKCELIGPDGETTPLPESLFRVLAKVADVLASGDAVTVVPIGQQLTTQQAANILNVSRQYLVRQIDAGKIPHTKTGKHRRLNVEDLLVYKEKRDLKRRKSLRELTKMSQEFGGYDELKQSGQ